MQARIQGGKNNLVAIWAHTVRTGTGASNGLPTRLTELVVPSRSLFRGRGDFRTVGGNYTTIPQLFKAHGYNVTGQGKIFHPGHASTPPGYNGPLHSKFGNSTFWTILPLPHRPGGGQISEFRGFSERHSFNGV